MPLEDPLYRPDDLDDAFEVREARGRRSSEHWALLIVSSVCVLGLALFPVLLSPDERGYGTHEQLGFDPCFPLAAWNVPCPGCGVTTSVTHITHGNVLASLRAQPLGFLLAVGSVVAFLFLWSEHLRGRDAWNRVALWGWPRIFRGSITVMALAWLYKIAAVRGWL